MFFIACKMGIGIPFGDLFKTICTCAAEALPTPVKGILKKAGQNHICHKNFEK